MSTTLTLRAVTPDEIAALSNAGYSAYRYHFSAYWDSETELNAYLDNEYHPQVIAQSMENTGVSWFFICCGNTITGFCKLTENSPVSGKTYSGMLLNKLYFLPGETGKGYGSIAFSLAEDIARARGQAYLWLEVLENNTGARHFYQSQGMSVTGYLPFITEQQSSHLLIMEKPL